ncbi:caspase family protein [Ectothiorhodospiraceae bacterium BW-2]|nr:caspase family protein [Ectothiorhodospiraceae bacterium BW-2]
MNYRLLPLLLSLLLSPWLQAQNRGSLPVDIALPDGKPLLQYQQSHALIIGISDYTAGWDDLDSIPTELDDVVAVLEEQSYQIHRLDNPDSRELEAEIKQFLEQYGYARNNRLLVYYSGHGYSLDNGRQGFLVPTDAPLPSRDEAGFRRKALNFNDILAWNRNITTNHVLFLFDSCFSGTILATKGADEPPPLISKLMAEPVRRFITAGSAGEEVPAHSVFTLASNATVTAQSS